MLLSEYNLNVKYKIKKILCAEKTFKRLNNMGLTNGTIISVVRRAPFGDPIEIKVRDFYLAIRLNLAKQIEVIEIE